MKIEIRQAIESCVDLLEERDVQRTMVCGVTTGFSRLNQLTSGLQNSDLITLCGISGIGKRALAYNIARHAAIEDNSKVSILNLSLTHEVATLRFLCAEARVDSTRISRGFLSREDWNKLTNAAGILCDAKIIFTDNIDEIYSDGLLIIDSFQMLSENRGDYSFDLVRKLKRKAVDENRPIIILSTLNRKQIDGRDNKRPQLSDFRYFESALADLSDLVISVYRDEIYNLDENNPNRGTAEIEVLKQRNGPIGTAVLTFLNSYARFEDLAIEPE